MIDEKKKAPTKRIGTRIYIYKRVCLTLARSRVRKSMCWLVYLPKISSIQVFLPRYVKEASSLSEMQRNPTHISYVWAENSVRKMSTFLFHQLGFQSTSTWSKAPVGNRWRLWHSPRRSKYALDWSFRKVNSTTTTAACSRMETEWRRRIANELCRVHLAKFAILCSSQRYRAWEYEVLLSHQSEKKSTHRASLFRATGKVYGRRYFLIGVFFLIYVRIERLCQRWFPLTSRCWSSRRSVVLFNRLFSPVSSDTLRRVQKCHWQKRSFLRH